MQDITLKIDKKVELWRHKLLDISTKNNLLNYQYNKNSNMKIIFPTFIELFHNLLDTNTEFISFSYPPNVNSITKKEDLFIDGNIKSNLNFADEQKTLYSLKKKKQLALEEQGVNTLYATFGLLRWGETQYETDQLAPIILVPVDLLMESITSPYKLCMRNDEVIVNPNLIYKLKKVFGINLPNFNSDTDDISDFFQKFKSMLHLTTWSIEETATLSILPFLKINMYMDLKQRRKDIDNHPIIKGLCGNSFDLTPIPKGFNYIDHDSLHHPKDIFQILDADSSQQDAIELSKRGVSFVLQGPPGTGKSQTITNIIAEALASGQKILFVSEKSSALKMVYNRLEQCDLNQFCLNLHNYKASKKNILTELEQCLTAEPIRLIPEAKQALDLLHKDKEILNSYNKELHTVVKPLNSTIFQVQSKLAELEQAPDLIFPIHNVRNITDQQFTNDCYLINNLLKTLNKLSEDYENNSWRGVKIQQLTHELRHDLESHLHKSVPIITEFINKLHNDLSFMELENSISLNNAAQCIKFFAHCAKSPNPPFRWFNLNCEKLIDRARQLQEKQIKLNILSSNVLHYYTEGIYDIDAYSYTNKLNKCFSNIKKLLKSYKDDANIFMNFSHWISISTNANITLNKLIGSSNDIVNILELDKISSLENILSIKKICENILQNYSPCSSWFNPLEYKKCRLFFTEAKNKYQYLQEINSWLSKYFTNEIFALNYSDLQNNFEQKYIPLFQNYTAIIKDLDIHCPKTKDDFLGFNKLCNCINQNLKISSIWFDCDEYEKARKLLDKVKKQQYRLKTIETDINKTYDTEIYHIDIDGLLNRFNTQYISFFKHLKKTYKDDKNLFLSHRKIPVPNIENKEIITLLVKLKERQQINLWFKTNNNELYRFLGKRYQGEHTDCFLLEKSMQEFSKIKDIIIFYKSSTLLALLKNGNCPKKILKYIKYTQNVSNMDLALDCLQMYQEDKKTILQYFKGKPFELSDDIILTTLNKLEEYNNIIKWSKENSHLGIKYFGDKYSGIQTDFMMLENDFTAFDELSVLVHNTFSSKLKNILCSKDLPEELLQFVSIINNGDNLNNIYYLLDLIYDQRTDITIVQKNIAMLNNDLTELSMHINKLLQYQKKPQSYDSIKTCLTELLKYQSIKSELENNVELQSEYGYFFSGINTNWQDLIKALNWTIEFLQLRKNIPFTIPAQFLQRISNDNMLAEVCKNLSLYFSQKLQEIIPEINWFNQYFNEDAKLSNVNIISVLQRLLKCQNNLSGLEEWIDFCNALKVCQKAQLETFVKVVLKEKLSGKNVINAFCKRFYRLWLDSVIKEYPAIANFRRRKFEAIIKEFRHLDQEQLIIARSRIREQLLQGLPEFNGTTSLTNDIGILRREVSKQHFIMPLRKLFEKIPALILKLKPCLMMSPLTVSMFLDSPEYKFDIVIFDEASQICTENAIGAIIRGKQVIIAGDSKQLPPSNFFNTVMPENISYENENILGYESILDEALTFLPEIFLRWHYRSKNEQLIAFSNSKIYHNSLITFPTAIASKPNLGVEYVYVKDGCYDRSHSKSNINEAERVAKLVFEHFKQYPHRSLGIIAFSTSQQLAIEDAIRKLRVELPNYEKYFNEDREESFFLKNLENVQGDERDTIIFSIGYAKDKNNLMYMDFGPLNNDGGYRRLNVAITRAKYNVKLVGSIYPEDIILEKTNSRGIKMLREYIEYAINNTKLLDDKSFCRTTDNIETFENVICTFLKKHNYDVCKNVGYSDCQIDIAIKHPTVDNKFILGIKCDGPAYSLIRTARDRERIRPSILEMLGWKIHHIWSTDWVKDPITEGHRLLNTIQSAMNSTLNEIVITNKIYNKKYEEIIQIKNSFDFAYYVETDITSMSYQNPVESLFQIIQTEGPIHYKLLCKRIEPIVNNKKTIDSYLKNKLHKFVNRMGDFFVLKNMMPITPRIPKEYSNPRPIDYISIDELKELLYTIILKSYNIYYNQAIIIASQELGLSYKELHVKNKLSTALDGLLNDHRLNEINGKLTV